MNKRLDILEHLKTAILVVLFFITILLLYLNYSAGGKNFSLAEILPSGRSTNVVVNIDDYVVPSYSVKSNENGRYLITYRNQKEAFDTASQCASVLLSASNINVSQISKDEYEAVCMEENSFQLIFDYDIPFTDYCNKILGKSLVGDGYPKGFRAMLFSDKIKSDLYLRDMEGLCYRISVAENYYSTDALAKVLSFDSGEMGFKDLYQLSFKKLGDEVSIDFENVPEAIFGDTLDFVRKISDGQGNETYMYGYGQKRLSSFADGGFEFKEDISGTNTPEFYSDLESALRFAEEKLGTDESLLRLISADLVSDESSDLYRFNFEAGEYSIVAEIKASTVSYFSVLPN